MTTVFPSIIPSGDDFVDDSYTEAELERMDYQELQSIAAEVDREDVHGRMPAEEMREALEGTQRV
ncbi:hypothetical protein OSG_eHP15_00080 [environmental Halophage eHP-15]|nr:hypothetical protein OSG_eHP15_00080 [environmental Halophage eHP-15]